VLERDRAGRGRQAGDVEVVLHQHGNAVQRPARAGLRPFQIEQRGVGQRVRVDEPHGVEAGPAIVERRDPLEVGLGQRDAGQLTGGHLRLQVGDGDAFEVERSGRGRRGRRQQDRHGEDQRAHSTN
jgi:hypothetical protein